MMLICVSGSDSPRPSGLLLLFFSPLSILSNVNEIDVLCFLSPKLSLLVTERENKKIISNLEGRRELDSETQIRIGIYRTPTGVLYHYFLYPSVILTYLIPSLLILLRFDNKREIYSYRESMSNNTKYLGRRFRGCFLLKTLLMRA